MPREALPADADQWVREGEGAEASRDRTQGKQKRLTLNLPAGMHTSFKGRCVLEGVTIQDKVQALIEEYLAVNPAPGQVLRRPFDNGGKVVLGSAIIHITDRR